MQLKAILNRVEPYKSFVYEKITGGEPGVSIEVCVVPRANSKPICSGCGNPGATYDHLRDVRRFGFVPLGGLVVFFLYRMRRVDCRECGVKVELLPVGGREEPLDE